MYQLDCGCHCQVLVSASQAGSIVNCSNCESVISIPRLSILKKFKVKEEILSHKQESNGDSQSKEGRNQLLWVITSFVLLTLFGMSGLPLSALVFFVALAAIIIGKFWLLHLMLREMGNIAILAFFTPLDWAFALMRSEITWKPVLLKLGGYLVLFLLVSSSN